MLNKRLKRRLVKKREKRDARRGNGFGERRERGRRGRERNDWLSSENRGPENERGREKGRGREKKKGGRGEEQDDARGLVLVPVPTPVLDLVPDPDLGLGLDLGQDLVLGVETGG